MPRAVRVDEGDRFAKAVGRLVTMLLPELILDRHGELVRAEVAGGNRHVRRKAEVGRGSICPHRPHATISGVAQRRRLQRQPPCSAWYFRLRL